jgi:hypothetical protein
MWKKLSSKVILSHPWMVVCEDEIQLPNGEITTYVRYPSGGQGVTVVAQNAGGKISFNLCGPRHGAMENPTTFWYSAKQIDQMIRCREIMNWSVLAAWALVRPRLLGELHVAASEI